MSTNAMLAIIVSVGVLAFSGCSVAIRYINFQSELATLNCGEVDR